METDTQKSTKLHIQPGNHCFLKICQPIYIDHMGCIAHIDWFGKKASQPCHFEVKFKQTSVFLDSQNFFFLETDTQKSTKLHIQPGNHCFLKICQPIYIDHIHVRCNALSWFLWQKGSQCHHFKVKFKQTLVFLDFSKLLLDGN